MGLCSSCVLCVSLAGGGRAAAVLEPFLHGAAEKSGVAVAALALCVLFMGGVPTMMSALALVQAMIRIHGLDKVKA